jgi:hypothetical protein
MPCQVGNESARDGPKHTAAFVVRAAVAAFVPSAGALAGVHFDKRGAKITIAYAGEDCAGRKDEIEERANKICDEISLDKLDLNAEDKESMAAFQGSAPSEVGGITLKKLSCNAAKQQIICEFYSGKKPEGGAAKSSPAPGGGGGKAKGGAAADVPKGPERPKLTGYDSTQNVCDSVIDDMFECLKIAGVSTEGKEDAVRRELTKKLETTLTSFKNSAYTHGFNGRIETLKKPHFA